VAAVSISDKVRFIESVFGSGTMARNGRNFAVKCPFCAPRDPQKRKLVILMEDDRTHCWTCGYKAHTLVPLVRKFGTRDQLIEYRDRFMPATEANVRCLFINLSSDEPERIALPKDFRLLVTASTHDPDVLAIKRYLMEPLPVGRALTERDLWYFKIGYSNDPRWKRRALVPSFDHEGQLNWFVGRAIDKRRTPRYDMPEGDKLAIVFNELNLDWTKEMVLCEGAFDLMKCPDNSVPLLGSDLNEQSAVFNRILANSTPVVLALDGDMRVKKTPKIARRLAGYDIPVRVVRMEADMDPGNASKLEMKQLIADARPLDWQDAFFDRLDAKARTSLA
jgi:hypothetical protein